MKKAEQDLLDFVTILTDEVDAYLESKRNVMIRENCAHSLEVFNRNTRELMDKASDSLSSSTQNLDHFDQEGETDALSYISSVADKLAVTYERSYLVCHNLVNLLFNIQCSLFAGEGTSPLP